MFGRKRRIEAATAVVRQGYDRAIVDAGVILFQQVAVALEPGAVGQVRRQLRAALTRRR